MRFSFVQITDHHLTESDSALLDGFSTRHAFRAVLRHIAQNPQISPDFIVSTGDLVEAASAQAYRAFLELVGAAPAAALPGPIMIAAEGLRGMPIYILPGNHDDRQHFFTALSAQAPPPQRMNATFEHKGVRCICLDLGPGSKAVVHPETLDFLERALATSQPCLIFLHHQLVPIGSRWLDALLADDLSPLWARLAGAPVLGIFSGHVHTTYERTINGVPVFGLRSTACPFVLQDEPLACLMPPHYRVVTIDGGRLESQIFEVPL